MARKMPTLDEKAWPELRKAKASAKTAWSYFSGLVKIMNRDLGEETTARVLRSLMEENARRFFVSGLQGFRIAGRDAWSMASYFKLATGDIIGYRAELEEEAPGKVVYRLHPPCLWFPDLDIPPGLCRALGNFEVEAARLVNPAVSVSCRRLMTAGDDCCEFVFEEG
jgi:hypothetical protein